MKIKLKSEIDPPPPQLTHSTTLKVEINPFPTNYSSSYEGGYISFLKGGSISDISLGTIVLFSVGWSSQTSFNVEVFLGNEAKTEVETPIVLYYPT